MAPKQDPKPKFQEGERGAGGRLGAWEGKEGIKGAGGGATVPAAGPPGPARPRGGAGSGPRLSAPGPGSVRGGPGPGP